MNINFEGTLFSILKYFIGQSDDINYYNKHMSDTVPGTVLHTSFMQMISSVLHYNIVRKLYLLLLLTDEETEAHGVNQLCNMM